MDRLSGIVIIIIILVPNNCSSKSIINCLRVHGKPLKSSFMIFLGLCSTLHMVSFNNPSSSEIFLKSGSPLLSPFKAS